MTDLRRQLDVEDDEEPVRVETWYDRHIRSWTTILVDAEGNQVGHAAFDGTREDRDASRRMYERALHR